MINFDQFSADIRNRGVLKSHSFAVEMVLPSELKGSTDITKIIIRCDAANIPSVSFGTIDFQRYGYGPQESIPFVPIYENVNLSFIMDSKAEVYQFFRAWMNQIISFDSSNGVNNVTSDGFNSYEIGYKNDYSTTIRIIQFDETGTDVIETTLYNAHPLAIQEIALNWNNTDQFIRMNILFTYKDITTKNINGINILNLINYFKNNTAQNIIDHSLISGLIVPGTYSAINSIFGG